MTIMIENYRHADLKDVVSVWNESLIQKKDFSNL